VIEHKSEWEFYHKSIGWELHNLPNVPIVVPPLIDTCFHALADASISDKVKREPDTDGLVDQGPSPHLGRPYTSDAYGDNLAYVKDFYGMGKGPAIEVTPAQWTFKVRSSGGWKQKSRTPKISLYLDGGKHICFNFKVSSRPVYKNISEVFEDLAKCRYELASVQLSARATVPMDELAFMQRCNDARFEQIKRQGLIESPPVPDLTNVIDMEAIRRQMVPILSSAAMAASLPLYGSVEVA
jgi:hypothetical protein